MSSFEMNSFMVVLCKFLAKDIDYSGYITYVFELLEKYEDINSKYIMCTRYPNWNHKKFNIGDEGYLEFKPIIAGESTWYDGNNFNKYNYNDIQFIQFVKKNDENMNIKLD